jgi:hypothetical protein
MIISSSMQKLLLCPSPLFLKEYLDNYTEINDTFHGLDCP